MNNRKKAWTESAVLLTRWTWALALWLCGEPAVFGQVVISPAGAHVLTNQTGTAHWAYCSVIVPAGNQGFVLTAENVSGTGPLELFIQSGAVNPTEAVYLKRSVVGSRLLELTAAELAAGEYRIGMLFQGASAGTSAQNRLRLIPILAPSGGALTNQVVNGSDLYFRLVATNFYPGFRAVLSKTNHAGVELSTLRGDRPEGATFIRSAVGSSPETVWATDTETTPGNYLLRIAGLAAGTNTVTLRWEKGFVTTLTWDPGTAEGGTQIVTNPPNDPGGWRFFRLNAQDTIVGAWRTVLRTTGAADFYMQVGPPLGNPASGQAGIHAGVTSNSARIFYTGQYSAGQDWYISVNTTNGNPWQLFSGEVFVHDLGALLPADADPANNTINPVATTNIGPEGVRFFRTTVASGTPAWRLWLNNGAGSPVTLPNFIEVRQTRVPIPAAAFDLRQSGQMLVVPTYLNQANAFFMAVSGMEGQTLNLDNRSQRIEDLAFGAATNNAAINGFRYRTFRVQVPPNVIGWQVNARTLSGDVDLSLRRTDVGNETTHLAVSSATGTTSDSIALVPPTLSDGIYFITVFGKAASTFTLQQGSPVVTDIPFVNSLVPIPGYTNATGPVIVNDDPNRNGWRYYRVNDIQSQLGVLGWLLQLTNHAPGTEIALRLSALPGRWSSGSHVDFGSTSGFLERQSHQAGVWYVGIYSPVAALGAFELETRPFLPAPVDPDAEVIQMANQRAGSWEYFELDVPDSLSDSNLLGLELQLTNASGNGLRLQMRRDQIPYDVGSGMVNANGSSIWPSGFYVSGGGDWSFRARPSGNSDYLFLPMGWPLQPGHYYVGVRNDSGQPRSYGLRITTVGPAGSDKDHLVEPMGSAPGSTVSAGGLNPREFRIHRLTVTNGTPNLRLQLNVTQGEARLFIRRNQLPGLPGPVGDLAGVQDSDLVVAMIQRAGSEIVTILPGNLQTNIPGGDYYLIVAAEGALANYSSPGIGTGPTSYGLSVLPPLSPVYLGAFGPGQELVIATNFTPPERRFYTLDIQAGVKALDVRMENLGGAPYLQWAFHSGLLETSASAFGGNNYGWIGGWGNYQRVTSPFQLIPPAPGRYSFVIESTSGVNVSNAAHLTLTTQDSLPLAAADGDVFVTNQPAVSWRFFQVDVPATAGGATPAAWDLKLINNTNNSAYMSVARERFPNGQSSGGGGALSAYNAWPTNAEYGADYYITRRSEGGASSVYQMMLGWGWPVAPGTYFVGVYNSSATPISYQVRSRLIGSSSSSLPSRVEELAWTGPGVLTTVSNLPAGEVRCFRLPVPPNTPMFRLRLNQLRGEARMTIRRGSVPGTHLGGGPFTDDDRNATAFARIGYEEVSALPLPGTNAVPPGDYYITAISEGEHPANNNVLGTNVVDFRLELLPDVQPVNFGSLLLNQTVSLTNITIWPNRAYGYLTIPGGARSLLISHQNLTNATYLRLRPGTNLISGAGPAPPDYLSLSANTWSGGESATMSISAGNTTWNNPPPGTYSFLLDPVDANDPTKAAAVTSFTLSGETALDFTNGEVAYVQAAVSWRYFRVDVPTNAANAVRGWEVRLADSPSNEGWNLYIRRDDLPDFSPNVTYLNDFSASWPSGAIYGGRGFDWPGRAVPGMANSGYFASMAWGRPLQPGTYFIGLYNGGQARSIRLLTRAIGDAGSGLPIEIEPLSFGATLTVSNLPPGTLKYYRITNLPPNLAGARWKLRPLQGDARIHVRRSAVPGISLVGARGGAFPDSGGQWEAAVPGNDYMIWWPQYPATTLPADDYYFIIAAEGSPTNPDNGMLGTGPTSFEISSSAFAPENLGQVTPNHPLTRDASYDAGEPLAYDFDVPAGTRALEVRLENRVGDPVFELGRGTGHLGNFAGWFGHNITNHLASQARYFVLPEPPTNRYWLTVGQAGNLLQAGSFRLSIRSLTNAPLSFSSLVNSNGYSNTVTGSLADGQRTYFTVDIPPLINGEAPVGWYLKLTALQGTPQVRIRPGNVLPQDGGAEVTGYYPAGLVVAPPYFRPGRWTVEVRAFGDSQFTLTSEGVQMERPAWTMPAFGQTPTTPGVAVPLFADSSVETNGVALPNDVDLAQGRYHFYAVDVPEGNAGLLRAELIAISGNSDLYVRAGNLPSLEAAQYSSFYNSIGGLYELALNSGAISDFANWVPPDTRRQAQLTPGRWYFMVHANGSNVRYRLRLGTGQVTELSPSGGSASGQNLAANDWRYYRFSVPTNPPQFWSLSVSQQQGDVDVFLRDTAPPGVAYQVNPATWAREIKNAGVSYLDYSTPGNWQFTAPQLRPGHVYYVGVKAVVDSQFSIASSTSGPLLTQAFPSLDYIHPEGGSVSLTLAPFERRTWRVNVPPDALRWKHVATNGTAVWLYLQNGSPPWAARGNPGDHWFSGGAANSIFETPLYDRAQGNWSWVRGETYFIAATNESAVAQTFSLSVDTRAWRLELAATNGTISPSPNKPYYETGEIVNLTPQPAAGHRFVNWAADLSGTNQPGQITMTAHRRVVALFEPIPYHINVTATGGVVQKSPNTPTHPYGSAVLLTATPNLGFEFVRWAGDLASFENPLFVEVTGDRNLTAIFRQVATKPVIAAQPQGGTFRANQPASLSVGAVGTEPMFYQWLKSGNPVAGANSALLSFTSLSTNDAGLYSVVITNVAGAALSFEAALNVEFIRALDFSNTTPIVIRDATSASPYPSVINVAGVSARIAGAAVTLQGLSHDWLEDVDLLLAGPAGTNVLMLSDAGRFAVGNLTLTLDDAAPMPVPETGFLASGSYQPANYSGVAPVSDAFLAPAPPSPYGSSLANFADTNPNGNWRLFVMDDYGKDAGLIAGGWTLSLQTLETVLSPAPTPMALQVETVTTTEGDEFGFSFAGMKGRTVRVESSTNLIDWVLVADIFVETGGEEFKEPVSGGGKFYRCQILP